MKKISIVLTALFLGACSTHEKTSRQVASGDICEDYFQAVCRESQNAINDLNALKTSLESRNAEGDWEYSEVASNIYNKYQGFIQMGGAGSQHWVPRCERAISQEEANQSFLNQGRSLSSINNGVFSSIRDTAQGVSGLGFVVVQAQRGGPLRAISDDIARLQGAMSTVRCPAP